MFDKILTGSPKTILAVLLVLIGSVVMGLQVGGPSSRNNLAAVKIISPAPTELRGTLKVVIIDDFDNKRSESRYTLSVVTGSTVQRYKLDFGGNEPSGIISGVGLIVRGTM